MTLADWLILLYTGVAVFVWHEWANFEFPKEERDQDGE
jgi:hypothetical protein